MAINTDLSRRRISELEDKTIEIVKSGEQNIKSEGRWKKLKFQSVERLPEDQTCIIGVPEEERNRSKGKEIMPKNFPNLKKHLNINTQET